MPPRLAALLIVLSCLVVAAPAAASERSEARRYAAAMEPKIAVTPEEGEALVAGIEARAAHVATTCLASVEAAAKKRERANLLMLLYDAHLAIDVYARYATWLKQGDERLAAIPTRSRTLRRARAVRPQAARMLSGLSELAPKDFCATVTAWEALMPGRDGSDGAGTRQPLAVASGADAR
jgi:hypothetical protein